MTASRPARRRSRQWSERERGRCRQPGVGSQHFHQHLCGATRLHSPCKPPNARSGAQDSFATQDYATLYSSRWALGRRRRPETVEAVQRIGIAGDPARRRAIAHVRACPFDFSLVGAPSPLRTFARPYSPRRRGVPRRSARLERQELCLWCCSARSREAASFWPAGSTRGTE